MNYARVILGNEIKYDSNEHKIIVDKSQHYDMQGKTNPVGENEKERTESLKVYILNMYKTMLNEGIKGTYVYVCDDGLREYLKQDI